MVRHCMLQYLLIQGSFIDRKAFLYEGIKLTESTEPGICLVFIWLL